MNRRRVAELMDHPALEATAHAQALRALNRVNRWVGADRRLWSATRQLGRMERFSVLDLGAGGGGFLAYVGKRQPIGRDTLLIGLDRSAFALRQARVWFKAITAVAGDARRIPLADRSVDVLTCSLFLHHFVETDVVRILREAARVARRGIVVSDLSRSRLAWVLTWITTRLTSRSRVFHVDGPRSVCAAFRAGELADFAAQAGLAGARVERRFPFRLMLIWRKPGGDDDAI